MGGHVFKGSQPIKKEHIRPTLNRFAEEINKLFDVSVYRQFKDPTLLGSGGKKDISGDIDLAVDQSLLTIMSEVYDENEYKLLIEKFQKRSRTATFEQLKKRAIITKLSEYINSNSDLIKTTDKGSGNGTLFCQFPQFDENDNDLGYEVQIDINFGNIEWLKFAYQSTVYPTNIKGLHRTQLMIALFTNKGYVFSHNYGVKNKQTQNIIATSPNKAINLLNKEYGFEINQDILSNFYSLLDFILKHISSKEIENIFDLYLKVLDSTRCDIPIDLQNYWIDNKERLELKGKYLPETSKLTKFL